MLWGSPQRRRCTQTPGGGGLACLGIADRLSFPAAPGTSGTITGYSVSAGRTGAGPWANPTVAARAGLAAPPAVERRPRQKGVLAWPPARGRGDLPAVNNSFV